MEQPSWVDMLSSHLCKGVYVLTEFDIVVPVFGKIIDIVTVDSTVVLCVQKYYGHTFHTHYNSYEISTRGGVVAVSVCSLADHRPLRTKTTFISSDDSFYNVTIYILRVVQIY